MCRYTIVIYWRSFTWTIRAWAMQPDDVVRGLVRDFDKHPISMKVMYVA